MHFKYVYKIRQCILNRHDLLDATFFVSVCDVSRYECTFPRIILNN